MSNASYLGHLISMIRSLMGLCVQDCSSNRSTTLALVEFYCIIKMADLHPLTSLGPLFKWNKKCGTPPWGHMMIQIIHHQSHALLEYIFKFYFNRSYSIYVGLNSSVLFKIPEFFFLIFFFFFRIWKICDDVMDDAIELQTLANCFWKEVRCAANRSTLIFY